MGKYTSAFCNDKYCKTAKEFNRKRITPFY